MEGFDDAGVFFSGNLFGENTDQQNERHVNMQSVKKSYKDFLRTFNEENFYYKYRWVKEQHYLFSVFFVYLVFVIKCLASIYLEIL